MSIHLQTDLVITLPNSARYEVGFSTGTICSAAIESIKQLNVVRIQD